MALGGRVIQVEVDGGSVMFDLSKVTRITVVSDVGGVEFENYRLWSNGVELLLQDDDRTLKVVPRGSE